MTQVKDRFPRWPRNSHSKKEDSMSTEQIEQNDQSENAHAEIEAGTEGQELNSDVDQLRNERDQLALQLTQSQDRLARLQAEFDNTRKREAKERQDVRDYAIQSAVEPFLGVLDNFSLALKSNGDVAQLRTGVELIVKQMDDALRGLNVQPVESVGSQFDPESTRRSAASKLWSIQTIRSSKKFAAATNSATSSFAPPWSASPATPPRRVNSSKDRSTGLAVGFSPLKNRHIE
jgi:molecular chaperone GrpE